MEPLHSFASQQSWEMVPDATPEPVHATAPQAEGPARAYVAPDQAPDQDQIESGSLSAILTSLGIVRQESLRRSRAPSTAEEEGAEEEAVQEPGCGEQQNSLLDDYDLFKDDDGAGESGFVMVPKAKGKPMRILIMTIGSRGDIQPFVVLSKTLQAHGHFVRLAGFEVFRDFVERNGIEFFPLAGDPRKLMDICVQNTCFGLSFMYEAFRFRGFYRELLDTCWQAAIEPSPDGTAFLPDAIIANPPVMAHYHIAEALAIPVHICFTMPWSRTKAFPQPMVLDRGAGSARYNKWSYQLVEKVTFAGLQDIINAWRRNTLHLRALSLAEGAHWLHLKKIPHTYCYSPELSTRPTDWAPHIAVTNFFFHHESSAQHWEPPAVLAAFLEAEGPKPIYVGFGSIPMADPAGLAKMVIAAATSTKVRLVMSKGWGMQDVLDNAPDNVFVIDQCPHDWLFPRLAAVVHHGGAGTLAAGLNAGKPTGIVAFFGDQYFWADSVNKAKVGMSTTIADVTQPWFELAFSALPEKDMQHRAEQLGEQIRQVDGPKETMNHFHAFIPANWPIEEEVEIATEFERKGLTLRWQFDRITASSGMLATKPKDDRGGPIHVELRYGWQWAKKGWEVVRNDQADSDGFQYLCATSNQFQKEKSGSSVRRRRWQRTRLRTPGRYRRQAEASS